MYRDDMSVDDTNCLEPLVTTNWEAVNPLTITLFVIVDNVVPLSDKVESAITPAELNLVSLSPVPVPTTALASEPNAPAIQ